MTTLTLAPTMREQLGVTAGRLLDSDPTVALVWAEISGQYLAPLAERHPDRVVNVGIREQLLVSAAAGMALAGMRPIVHTFSPFLVERAFEQVKLDFGHQDVGGVLASSGGSWDVTAGGRTHMAPGDMALMDTLDAGLHAPSTPREADELITRLVADGGLHYVRLVGEQNCESFDTARGFHVVRRRRSEDAPVVLALGPVLDDVLAATEQRDVTVLYAATIRPFDATTLRSVAGPSPQVVLVEPWLAGTSARVVSDALVAVPHRLLSLGVPSVELRRYGTPEEHRRELGLDAAGLRRSIDEFVR